MPDSFLHQIFYGSHTHWFVHAHLANVFKNHVHASVNAKYSVFYVANRSLEPFDAFKSLTNYRRNRGRHIIF